MRIGIESRSGFHRDIVSSLEYQEWETETDVQTGWISGGDVLEGSMIRARVQEAF